MAKYYRGTTHSSDFKKNPIVCTVCDQKVMIGKLREDKKLVCIGCWDGDVEREKEEIIY